MVHYVHCWRSKKIILCLLSNSVTMSMGNPRADRLIVKNLGQVARGRAPITCQWRAIMQNRDFSVLSDQTPKQRDAILTIVSKKKANRA
ncbi:hypothetical protein BC940DRAFT_149874 [Gongronella butleri]|nr:hypothetical protein BC940DRAFT_149874 [Gongronella butleri]